jgi:hypothetical protein
MSVRERGALLTAWLALMLVANALTVFLYSAFAISPFGRSFFFPDFSLWVIYVFIFFGALNFACTCFLFLWKKWAFFVLCASAVAVFVLNLFLGMGAFAFFGLASVVVLYLIIRPKWGLFTDF